MGKLQTFWNAVRRHKYGFVIVAFVLLIGVVFSILLTAFTIWDLNRRMEGSYYDGTM